MKVILVLLAALSFRAFGFINIENLRTQPVEGYLGNLDLSGQFQSGNTDKNILNFNSMNRYSKGKNEFLALANYRYGETFNLKDTHRGSAHLRYSRKVFEKVFAETFIQTQFDDFRALNRRDLLGVNGRFEVHRSEYLFLFTGAGFFGEREQINVDPNEDNVRGNFYISTVYDTKDKFKASLVLYYQPMWNELKDHRFNLTVNLESPIYKTLSLLVTYDSQYDSQPPTTVGTYDSLALIGVRWTL
jgi:putative salt-induced outer membrane protein YdiY